MRTACPAYDFAGSASPADRCLYCGRKRKAHAAEETLDRIWKTQIEAEASAAKARARKVYEEAVAPTLKAYKEARARAKKSYEEAASASLEGLRRGQGGSLEGLRGVPPMTPDVASGEEPLDKSNGTGCPFCGVAYSMVFHLQFHVKDCQSQR